MLIKIGKTFEIVGLCGSFCRSCHGNVPAEKMKKAPKRLRVAFFAKVYMKRKFQEMPVSLIVPFWRAAQFRGQWTGRLVRRHLSVIREMACVVVAGSCFCLGASYNLNYANKIRKKIKEVYYSAK